MTCWILHSQGLARILPLKKHFLSGPQDFSACKRTQTYRKKSIRLYLLDLCDCHWLQSSSTPIFARSVFVFEGNQCVAFQQTSWCCVGSSHVQRNWLRRSCFVEPRSTCTYKRFATVARREALAYQRSCLLEHRCLSEVWQMVPIAVCHHNILDRRNLWYVYFIISTTSNLLYVRFLWANLLHQDRLPTVTRRAPWIRRAPRVKPPPTMKRMIRKKHSPLNGATLITLLSLLLLLPLPVLLTLRLPLVLLFSLFLFLSTFFFLLLLLRVLLLLLLYLVPLIMPSWACFP